MLNVGKQGGAGFALLRYVCASRHTFQCCSEKSGGGEDVIVYREFGSLERDLGFSIKTLYSLSNNLEKHYRNAYLPKRDKTMRKLSVPDTILKKVQRSIAKVILAQYPVSRYARGYVFGFGVKENARPHVGKEKILKLDIDGFFATHW